MAAIFARSSSRVRAPAAAGTSSQCPLQSDASSSQTAEIVKITGLAMPASLACSESFVAPAPGRCTRAAPAAALTARGGPAPSLPSAMAGWQVFLCTTGAEVVLLRATCYRDAALAPPRRPAPPRRSLYLAFTTSKLGLQPQFVELLRMLVERILCEVFPEETGAARLQQVGLFTLIFVLQ